MADDEIRYDLLTQDALRGVIRRVLTLVQRSGLPGQHHLYIAFDTGAEGVSVSKRLKEQYPEEMTIVLQYQFWDLQVSNERFEVKLSFGSLPERLVVPFQAVKAFYDPSAQFGLQFGKPGAANDSCPPAYGFGPARPYRRCRRIAPAAAPACRTAPGAGAVAKAGRCRNHASREAAGRVARRSSNSTVSARSDLSLRASLATAQA